MKKKKILRIIFFILIIVWMCTVFGLSNQNSDESSGLSQKIAGMIVGDEEEKIQGIEPIIRKLAHLTEYTLGGMLFISLFLTYNFSDRKRMLFSFFIGAEYAMIDEIHQLFIPGRSGQITDVLIDSFGVILGICIIMIFYKIIIKRKKGKAV